LAAEDLARIKAVLGYYVNNLWLTHNMLPFRNPDKPDDALRYKAFLDHLGIPGNQIRFAFFDARERSVFRAKWKRVLKLTWRYRDPIETIQPSYTTNSASDRCCAIEPTFRGTDPKNTSCGSAGLRFLMVMAAIRFGCEDD
jgi:hypothetical protein